MDIPECVARTRTSTPAAVAGRRLAERSDSRRRIRGGVIGGGAGLAEGRFQSVLWALPKDTGSAIRARSNAANCVSAERTPVSQSARSMPRVQVATTRGQGSPKPTSSSCGRCSRRCSTTTALRHEERWRRDGSSCSGTRARSQCARALGNAPAHRLVRAGAREARRRRGGRPSAQSRRPRAAGGEGFRRRRGACRHGRSAGRRRRRGSDLRELSGARVWVEAASWVGGGCRTPSAAAAPPRGVD